MNRVEVKRISYYPPSKGFTVLLKEKNGDRKLQILVKSHKAQAIARYFEGAKMYRPMIHDVVIDIVENLDAKINKVLISHIDVNKKYYTQIEINNSQSGNILIETRPSDAIAISLRNLVPIYISDEVMDSENIDNIVEDINIPTNVASRDISYKISDKLVLESLKDALEKAILNEDYELAAKLRDRINQL